MRLLITADNGVLTGLLPLSPSLLDLPDPLEVSNVISWKKNNLLYWASFRGGRGGHSPPPPCDTHIKPRNPHNVNNSSNDNKILSAE